VSRTPSEPAWDSGKLRGLPRKGDKIAGVYRVENLVGLGGMGAVLAAMHSELKTRVAIKVMLPEGARLKVAVARFLREARAASAIQSEHVVRIFDVGRLKNGLPYMIMEFLAGVSLQERVERQGPVPFDEAVGFVLQGCEAIAQAHAIGVVHRDLKPGNLFLSRRPDGTALVKVLDFGISKAQWMGDPDFKPELTQTTDIIGTPTYMSPEQVRCAKEVDWRTDIWSIGAVLYELCTGEPPFEANSLPALSALIVSEQPAPPTRKCPTMPQELESVILWCLAKDPEMRPQTVHEIATRLAPYAPPWARESVERILRTAAPNTVLVGPGEMPPESEFDVSTIGNTAGGWGTTAHESRGRSKIMVAALLVAGVGAAALAAAMFISAGESEQAAGPAPSSSADPSASAALSSNVPPMPAPSATASTVLATTAPPSASSSKPPKPVPKPGGPGIKRDPLDVRY